VKNDYLAYVEMNLLNVLLTTWERGVTGTHGNNPEYIVTAIEQLLDMFLNDYYKANLKKRA